jgi:hypothetical protein
VKGPVRQPAARESLIAPVTGTLAAQLLALWKDLY